MASNPYSPVFPQLSNVSPGIFGNFLSFFSSSGSVLRKHFLILFYGQISAKKFPFSPSSSYPFSKAASSAKIFVKILQSCRGYLSAVIGNTLNNHFHTGGPPCRER